MNAQSSYSIENMLKYQRVLQLELYDNKSLCETFLSVGKPEQRILD